MKEKELRLALVLFGGVSLAIYQHGINREMLNLIRASRAYHDAPRATEKQHPDHRIHPSPGEAETTLSVYFDLLKTIGSTLDLRVIVDVIAGASAGGINGITLARALAHDLDIEPLTDMWLEKADMLDLLAPEARARMWSKWYFWPLLQPLLSWLGREALPPGIANREMRERLSVFMRSRWFKPPLDGPKLTTLLLDGLTAMGTPAQATQSLMPSGTRLDLLVTVTNFHGSERSIFIHDPPLLHEREHRHVLRFSCTHHKSGALDSDFGADNIPTLAFAGRASASYPGAFPPAQIAEIDRLLAARQEGWPGRAAFLAESLPPGATAEDLVLLDGSILDNKPVMATVEMIRTHSAFREIDRRLVFIDPHPGKSGLGDIATTSSAVPGFFTTLRGALSDLPRQEPMHDELAEISRYNKQVRRLKAAILTVRPKVAHMIDTATAGGINQSFTVEQLQHWRLTSSNLMADNALVYDQWMRTLIMEGVDFLVAMLCHICGAPPDSPHGIWLQHAIEAWAHHNGVLCQSYHVPDDARTTIDMPTFAQFIIAFGVDYKKRRINFVLHELNALYSRLEQPGYCTTDAAMLDAIKADIHACLDQLSEQERFTFLDDETTAAVRRMFGTPETGHPDLATWLDAHNTAISQVIARLGDASQIASANADMDQVLTSPRMAAIGAACRRDMLTGYLGYFYWDILLRPVISALSLRAGPIEEILIDRISPDDSTALKRDDGRPVLMGGSVAGFGGFLSRTTRENDFLWGRMHAVDRLIDIVARAADPYHPLPAGLLAGLKKRGFMAVLNAERAHLKTAADLISSLDTQVSRL